MKRNLVGKILGKIKIFVQNFVPIRTALIANIYFLQEMAGVLPFIPLRHDTKYPSSDLNLAFDSVLFSRVLTEGILREELFQKRNDQPWYFHKINQLFYGS